MTAADRIQIAELRLNLLGDPYEGEPPERAAKREHYLEMRRAALAEIGEAQRANLPYKDDE